VTSPEWHHFCSQLQALNAWDFTNVGVGAADAPNIYIYLNDGVRKHKLHLCGPGDLDRFLRETGFFRASKEKLKVEYLMNVIW